MKSMLCAALLALLVGCGGSDEPFPEEEQPEQQVPPPVTSCKVDPRICY